MSKNILRGPTLRKSHILFILSWSREDDDNKLLSELVFLFLKTMASYRRESCLTHPVSFTLLNLKWYVRMHIEYIIRWKISMAPYICTFYSLRPSRSTQLLSCFDDKSVETVPREIRFSSVLEKFPLFPPNNVEFSISAQTTAPSQNWMRGLGDQRIDTRWKWSRGKG